MRLAFLAACVVLLVGASARAQPAGVERAFTEGNRRYADGDYEGALRQYETALASEWASGALYYNVAGAHYRLGHLGQAVRYYEKARRLLPAGSAPLAHNLSVVRSRLAETPPPPPSRSPLAVARERLASFVSPLACVVVGWLLCLGALAWWGRRSSARATRRLRPGRGPATLLAAGVLAAALGAFLSARSVEGRAVALRQPLTLRAAPAAGADSAAAVPEGTVLRLTEHRDDWARVRSSRGDAGWARAETLGEI